MALSRASRTASMCDRLTWMVQLTELVCKQVTASSPSMAGYVRDGQPEGNAKAQFDLVCGLRLSVDELLLALDPDVVVFGPRVVVLCWLDMFLQRAVRSHPHTHTTRIIKSSSPRRSVRLG